MMRHPWARPLAAVAAVAAVGLALWIIAQQAPSDPSTSNNMADDVLTADNSDDVKPGYEWLAEGEKYAQQAPGWTVASSTDPMDDQRYETAQAYVEGDLNDVRVTVRCAVGQSRLVYDFEGYDKQREGARIRVRFEDGEYNEVSWRADRQPMRIARTRNSPYTNQTSLKEDAAITAAAARALTIRIDFADSQETYQVDQADPAFRRVVQPCLDRAAQEAVDRERRQAEQEQELTSTPSDPSPADPGERAEWNSF